jgi:dTDP-4-amino-4,6-dideoxygalactose transaminase
MEGKWPVFDSDEVSAVQRVLNSGRVNYWTGTECRDFESEFASYHGVKHGIALANGTLALELALRVLGVGPGDEVIVTPRSFFASAACVVQVGASPVFADVDRHSQNIDARDIEAKISPRTKAILPVHLAGWPCDMQAIMSLSKEYGLHVIEDCAQAHGAKFDGRSVGSFGSSAAFSFCQDKIMSTAGEGGMLITNDHSVWQAAWEYKDHGKSFELAHSDNHPLGFRWLHASIGSNYRMTEIQAAVGRIQLRKLDRWVERRRYNASRLIEAFSDLPALRIPVPSEREYHAYYKFYAFVQSEALKATWSRDRIIQTLDANGVPGWSGGCPEIYREAALKGMCHPVLPVARELGETSIMLPVHPTLTDEDLDEIVQTIRKVLAAATR